MTSVTIIGSANGTSPAGALRNVEMTRLAKDSETPWSAPMRQPPWPRRHIAQQSPSSNCVTRFSAAGITCSRRGDRSNEPEAATSVISRRCRSTRATRALSSNCSASRRSDRSRAIFETPTICPASSRSGDTVSEIGTSVPSLRCRIVSKCKILRPRRMRASTFILFALPIRRDDDADRTADRFVGRVAEQQLRAAVPRLNGAVEVLAHDRIVGRRDDGGQPEIRGRECSLAHE